MQQVLISKQGDWGCRVDDLDLARGEVCLYRLSNLNFSDLGGWSSKSRMGIIAHVSVSTISLSLSLSVCVCVCVCVYVSQ